MICDKASKFPANLCNLKFKRLRNMNIKVDIKKDKRLSLFFFTNFCENIRLL